MEEEMTEKDTLSPARRRAVQALVSAVSLDEAAEKARVRKETLWRWLSHDGKFQQAVKEERRRQRTAACIAAEALLSAAVETLEKAMHDESLPPEVRVEASRATFEVAIQLYKLTALEDRIAALDTLVKERAAKGAESSEGRKGLAAEKAA
jgi:hypothetical protein